MYLCRCDAAATSLGEFHRMKLIGLEKAGYPLSNLTQDCLTDCEEVKAAIPYAQYGNGELLLFEAARQLDKPVTFYGRIDGTCPIDPKVLRWFLVRTKNTADVECRLVPHWLHAKVIWWVGVGAYIGSANLTDRAWSQNHEAGVFLTQNELDSQGMTQHLDAFFDQVAEKSIPLDETIYNDQLRLHGRLKDLHNSAYRIQREFEESQIALKDQSSPITYQPSRSSFEIREKRFVEEWHETLAYLKPLASRVSAPENRPSWVNEYTPPGVQCDQFLHAYYYNIVDPRSERNAYLTFFELNKSRAEQAMKDALAWWKRSDFDFEFEKAMMDQDAPMFVENFAQNRLLDLDRETFAVTLANTHAFGMHSSRMSVEELGFTKSPGAWPKILAHARMIYDARSASGMMSGPEVFHYVIWGSGDVAQRIWTASHDPDYRLDGVGISTFGEIVGWTRPYDFPPRNQRTNKAIKALGRKIKVS
jgi:hypothetical protein